MIIALSAVSGIDRQKTHEAPRRAVPWATLAPAHLALLGAETLIQAGCREQTLLSTKVS